MRENKLTIGRADETEMILLHLPLVRVHIQLLELVHWGKPMLYISIDIELFK